MIINISKDRLIQCTTTVIGIIALLIASAPNAEELPEYTLQPGDVLQISVWKEDDLRQGVVIRPDGFITFPLVGETRAAGHTIENVRLRITEKLKKYIPDPLVSISTGQLAGNRIYIIGKVQRPGAFAVTRNVDIVQALSTAGGTGTYAAVNKIKVLRRINGKLEAIPFRYGDVEKGKNLEQNIILKAGDVVIVP